MADQKERPGAGAGADTATSTGTGADFEHERMDVFKVAREIARGSAGEAAAQLDVLSIRGVITNREHEQARRLLLRVAQMLSRLCGSPRTT